MSVRSRRKGGGDCGGWRRCAKTRGSECRIRCSSAWWTRRGGCGCGRTWLGRSIKPPTVCGFTFWGTTGNGGGDMWGGNPHMTRRGRWEDENAECGADGESMGCSRKRLSLGGGRSWRHGMRRSVLVAGATVAGSRRAASTAPCVSEIEWSSRAPRGGAWIETHYDRRPELCVCVAPLVGARGLKRNPARRFLPSLRRAPRGGAWIETLSSTGDLQLLVSRPSWGRVD